nr:hypothetical protein [uncultured Hyphomonas sp.]
MEVWTAKLCAMSFEGDGFVERTQIDWLLHYDSNPACLVKWMPEPSFKRTGGHLSGKLPDK